MSRLHLFRDPHSMRVVLGEQETLLRYLRDAEGAMRTLHGRADPNVSYITTGRQALEQSIKDVAELSAEVQRLTKEEATLTLNLAVARNVVDEIGEHSEHLERQLALIPKWVRRIFGVSK